MYTNGSIAIGTGITSFDYLLLLMAELAILLFCAAVCFAPFDEFGWRPKWLALPPILPLFVLVNYCLFFHTEASVFFAVILILGIAVYFIIATAIMRLQRRHGIY